MGTPSYTYDEAKMLEGIRIFREETKLKAETLQLVPKINPTATQEVISKVADMYRITPDAILSGCKEAHIVRAREIIVLILRRRYGYSLARIGGILGRHHTSIMHLEQIARRHYEDSSGLRQLVDDIAGVSLSLKRDESGLPL